MMDATVQRQLLLDTVFTFGWVGAQYDDVDGALEALKEVTYTMAYRAGVSPEEIVWWERLGASRLP